MKERKVLIITYYWSPSGGSGVQRWIKFVKYLPQFNWQPTVYIPENPEYPSIDHSFEKDIPKNVKIIKKRIWEPYTIYQKLLGKKNQKITAGFISTQEGKSWKDKLAIAIRGNFLIPDPREFWVKPSVRFLKKYLVENKIDTIVTTGPPHSMHLIGMGLKKQLPNIRWIADFRDPWTEVFNFSNLRLTYFAKKYHQYLEKKVLKKADDVIVVSPEMQRDFKRLGRKATVITNGFDHEDYSKTPLINENNFFTIAHIGTLTENQNPTQLWKVLREICQENKTFREMLRIRLVGKVDFSVLSEIKKQNLESQLSLSNYLPHSKAIEEQQQANLLLLLLVHNRKTAKGILTGKLFEYLAVQRPILAIGATDSDVADILEETKAGNIVDFEDAPTLKEKILTSFNNFKVGNQRNFSSNIDKYTRQNLTQQLVKLLEKNKKGIDVSAIKDNIKLTEEKVAKIENQIEDLPIFKDKLTRRYGTKRKKTKNRN